MVAEVCNLQQGDSWITPIYKFLAHGTLLNDKVQPKQIRYKSARYLIINDQLYKRGFTLPYLRCLTLAEAEIVLREIHEGVCGDHAGSRSLAHKTFRQGYYWPTLHQMPSEYLAHVINVNATQLSLTPLPSRSLL
ncbi:hypothetical protein ACFX11_014781 [Malus domestica]